MGQALFRKRAGVGAEGRPPVGCRRGKMAIVSSLLARRFTVVEQQFPAADRGGVLVSLTPPAR